MKCPKCGENTSKDDRICRNCGTLLKKEKKGFLPFFGKKSKPANVPLLETTAKSTASAEKFKYVRMAAIVGVAAVVIILIIMLVFHVAAGKGRKQAEKFASYIGSKVTVAEKELDLHMKDSSTFHAVNKADSFDYIYESEDSIKVNEASFPEWAITVLKTEAEKIDQVIFTDYRILKKDPRGVKAGKRLDLDRYESKTKMTDVLDDLDIDPFRITYDVSFIKYEFRYYYELDNGDMQSVILNVVSNIDNKFMYSVSEDVDPILLTIKDVEPKIKQ